MCVCVCVCARSHTHTHMYTIFQNPRKVKDCQKLVLKCDIKKLTLMRYKQRLII